MHIFTPGHAMLPGTNIPVQDGSLARYRAMQRRLGLTRTVIVQPTAYGFDNTVTLNAMAELGNARGVAVVDPAAPDAEIARLSELGMRGLRFHMLPGGALRWDALESMAARVRHSAGICNSSSMPPGSLRMRRGSRGCRATS